MTREEALARALHIAVPGYARWFNPMPTTGVETQARTEAAQAEARSHAAAILAVIDADPELRAAFEAEAREAALASDRIIRWAFDVQWMTEDEFRSDLEGQLLDLRRICIGDEYAALRRTTP